MSSTEANTPLYNLSGALIFTAYVASALFLVAFIHQSISRAYDATPKKKDDKLHRNLQVFSALSVLSFSTLSYHMLAYLIISYRSWATQHGYELPQRLFGGKAVLNCGQECRDLYVWSWLTTSTLFQDFANEICATHARFWWTQQALLATMAWSVFMSIEGRRRKIPHLWAYAFISQILPVSFAANLFFLAMLLTPVANPNNTIRTTNTPLQVVILAVYHAFVALLPHVAGTQAFIGIVITMRLLLFCPIFLPAILPRGFGSRVLKVRDAYRVHEGVTIFVAGAWMVLTIIETSVAFMDGGVGFLRFPAVIDDSYAVKALAYDFVVGAGSALAWIGMIGKDLA